MEKPKNVDPQKQLIKINGDCYFLYSSIEDKKAGPYPLKDIECPLYIDESLKDDISLYSICLTKLGMYKYLDIK